jgi:hypothetical protein
MKPCVLKHQTYPVSESVCGFAITVSSIVSSSSWRGITLNTKISCIRKHWYKDNKFFFVQIKIKRYRNGPNELTRACLGIKCLVTFLHSMPTLSEQASHTKVYWCSYSPTGLILFSLIEQALKYRSVTDIVRPIREIVRRRKKTTGHSVRRKWNWGLLFVRPECICVRPNCSFVQRKSKCTLAQD